MIKILADSACDLTPDEAKELGVEIIPIKVRFGEKEYIPNVDLTTAEFYKKLAGCKKLPTTSLINQATYEDVLKSYVDAGEDVFVLCLSSGLSGSYASLCAAQSALASPHVAVCDSENAALGYRIIVQEAVKIAKQTDNLQELCDKVNELKKKCTLLAVIDDVSYLIKGGRLSTVAGIAVSALKIKPVITIADKVVKVKSKCFCLSRGLNTLVELKKNYDETKTV